MECSTSARFSVTTSHTGWRCSSADIWSRQRRHSNRSSRPSRKIPRPITIWERSISGKTICATRGNISIRQSSCVRIIRRRGTIWEWWPRRKARRTKLSVASNFDQAYLNLARLYVLLEEKQKAKEVLLALLQQQPQHKVAQKELEMLQ